MKSLLAKYASAALLLGHVVQLAYVAPGSFGQHEDHLDGATVTLLVLTMVNFVVPLVVCVVGLPLGGRFNLKQRINTMIDVQSLLLERVGVLLDRRWQAALAVIGLGALAATFYGILSTKPVVNDLNGGYHRLSHGKFVAISHAQYASAVHPGLMMIAGIITILQIVAFGLTILAIDRLSFRARGISTWPDVPARQ